MQNRLFGGLATLALLAVIGCSGGSQDTARESQTGETPSPLAMNEPAATPGSAPAAGNAPAQAGNTGAAPGQAQTRQPAASSTRAPANATPAQPQPGATNPPAATGGGAAQRPGGGGGMRGMGRNPMMLVGMDEVAAELKLTEAQKTKIQTTLREAMGSFRRGEGEAPDMAAVQKAMEGVEKAVMDVLDPSQEKRLKELMLQRQGAMALNDPDVQKELGLSSGQTIALEKIGKEMAEQMRPPAGAEGQRPDMSKWREAREAAQKRMLDVLTPAQKAKLEAMKGKAFTFPERQRGGGGGAPTAR